ncbi:MAG TPA: hypothetical protein PKM36_04955 [Propionibacteriaceae bacterium]|nr:hypothetical protein [Propionibacteriaceae bacterium]HPZ48742.1 hypothetical protein [Propionibacteriaceae bacterium]HQE30957.1 hypothetical protein [Propionibacteriaceae bacterium]
MSGAWRWMCDVEVPDQPSFPSQADAEAWLTDAYPDLIDAGASEVTLLEGDRVVYGPMSLSE